MADNEAMPTRDSAGGMDVEEAAGDFSQREETGEEDDEVMDADDEFMNPVEEDPEVDKKE